MTNETIQIFYFPVDSIAGVTVYHETAVYTNSEGQMVYSSVSDTVPEEQLNLSDVGIAHNMVAAALILGGCVSSWVFYSCKSIARDSRTGRILLGALWLF
jgi:hypothetical protein